MCWLKGGTRFCFKTCEPVVGYIRQSGFHLPHLYDRTIFNRHIEWGLPEVGKTAALAPSRPHPAPGGGEQHSREDPPV